MAKQSLVLYPSPAIGHLISTVELGKLILKHHPSFSITILVTTPPYNTGTTDPYINRVSQTNPLINFHHLPIISLSLDSKSEKAHMEDLAFRLLHLNNPLVHQALQSISTTSSIKAIVIDAFCTHALEIASELNIPAFYFHTSCINTLALFLYFPTLHKNTSKSFKDLKAYFDIPGIPSILGPDMPQPCLNRNERVYETVVDLTSQIAKTQGILVNSVESFEPRALEAIRAGLCVLDGSTPPIYTIGPLIADRDDGNGNRGQEGVQECLSWLDSQPSRSVVFLCFGSLGLFSEFQLKEIAIGLENSGERFLWVVRSPPTEDKVKRFLAPPEPDLDILLPKGFLERTKDRGLVVKSWAPQVEILSRESVGGFVTHCGWNSVLEAINEGVPMVGWPLYAEQKVNKVFLVEEMKVALPMDETKDGFVTATEVENRVRQIMDSDEGTATRVRTLALRDAARTAMCKGGSSLLALSEFLESVLSDLAQT